MNRIKYFLHRIFSIAMLPILISHGKAIRKKAPKLPEAKDPQGSTNTNYSSSLSLITLGESTIAGVGVDYHINGFSGALAKELSHLLQKNIHWNVYAKSGYTAKKVTYRLIDKIEEKPDMIVIGLGGNDAFTLNRVSKWASQIETLIESLQSKFPKAILIFTNMPPIKEFPAFTKVVKLTIGTLVEYHGETLTKVVKNYKDVHYIEEVIRLDKWIDKLDGKYTASDFFSDGVHPSAMTYRLWAKEVAVYISTLA